MLIGAGLPMAAAAAPTAEAAAPVAAAETAAEPASDIVVTGKASAKAQAAARLDAVAGGTGLVDNAQAEKGGLLTNADVLALQPGVYARTAAGSDGIKISIRGSSVNRGANFFRSGALFEFDGLPVTGPGGTPYELFEPLGIDHTEILRGVNGFPLGSTMLGGAINYVSPTGAGASPLAARLETGSYGYRKYQATSGGEYGPLDYYLSITGARRDGYEAQSRSRSFGISANLGYQIAPDITTRFYVRYRRTSNQTPGPLTLAQIADDPRQANPIYLADPSGRLTPTRQNQSRIQPGSKWFANKTRFDFNEGGTLSLGLVYHDYPIEIRTLNDAKWGEKDISGVLQYQRHDSLFGRDSVTDAGVLVTSHPSGSSYQDTFVRISSGVTATTPPGTLTRHAYYTGRDGNLRIANDSQPLADLHVLLGVAAVRVERGTGVTYPFIAGLTTPYERKDWHVAPRGGVRWEAARDLQFFANVSRSVEPPNDWAILSMPPAIPNSLPGGGLAARALDLKDQFATTYEIGSRGKLPVVGAWSLSLYRADVRNELLSVEVVPATATAAAVTAESNASPTRHQGVEAGLETTLWRAADDASHFVALRQSYTYNDFRFRGDATFGRNRLPGIPEHFYQAQLTYQHPSGFYASATATVASKNWLDYANSVSAKPYHTWGTTVGLDIPQSRYKIFVDFENLANKHYAAVVSPVYNLAGSDTTNPRLTPGDGFTVVGGVSFGF